MHTIKKLRGFTLIELLIVIAIIAILTVAFLPTLRGGQSLARDAARKSLLANVVTALENYVNEGNAAPADAAGGTVTGDGICLSNVDYAISAPVADAGETISQELGRVPDFAQSTLTSLCANGGLWYNLITGSTNEFVLAIQVENASSANVENGIAATGTNDPCIGAPSITQTDTRNQFVCLSDGTFPDAAAPFLFAIGRFN